MQITKLKLTDITVKERLRGVDSEKVERLKESILRIGLIHPITVSGGVLVAGLHRLTAFKELGYEEIDCHLVDDDELLSREIEIDENLYRNELTVLEKGKMEAIKKRNEEEWRKRQLNIEFVQTPEEVKYELAKLEKVVPEAKEILRGTAYENDKTVLLDLAELSKDAQISVTSYLKKNELKRIMRGGVVSSTLQTIGVKVNHPHKDDNQIKAQFDDETFAIIEEICSLYGYTKPGLIKAAVKVIVGIWVKPDPSLEELEIKREFDSLSGNLSRDEYQDTRRGSSI